MCHQSADQGVLGACTLTYMLSGALLQRALLELIVLETPGPA